MCLRMAHHRLLWKQKLNLALEITLGLQCYVVFIEYSEPL